MNTDKYDAPACLISRVSLARGGAQPLNFANMASRSRGWLRITEFRFVIDPGTFAAGGGLGDFRASQYGQLICLDAGIGRHRITNGQVPIWLLGPRLSYFGEVGQQAYLLDANANALPIINSYTWKLPKPVLVPPGTSLGMLLTRPLVSTLQDNNTYLPNAMTVEVAAVGTRLAKPPKSRLTDVPYVTFFRTLQSTTSPILESGQGLATAGSLANPFTKELTVERFNQRTAAGAANTAACDFNTFAYNSGGIGGGSNLSPSNIRMRLFQDHYEVISETVPKPQAFSPITAGTMPDDPQGKVVIDTIFNPQWATWRVNARLPGKKWYNVEFSTQGKSDNGTAVGFSKADNYDIAPMLAMVGSRKEYV